jgi:ribosomal protein S18 acetylase RimI-like enzyme
MGTSRPVGRHPATQGDAHDMRCAECDMAYDEDVPGDRREHRKHHDTVVNGLPRRRLRTERVISEDSSARLLVVRHRTAALSERRRAQRVAQLANRDTRFDFAAYHAGDSDEDRDPHVFLLEVNDRFVGLLVAERREYVQRFTWEEYGEPTGGPLPKADPVWSICMLWIHAKYRRQGFAVLLVTRAIRFLGTSLSTTGWYTPFTDSGEALARKLCPDSFLVAK